METSEPRRFLAPLGKPRDYVDRPELAVQHEPECVGPAIVENYAEVNRLIFTQQHAVDVAQAQERRPGLCPDHRVADVRRRAKDAHVDLSHELHLVQRAIDKARLRGQPVAPSALVRLEGLEALLDGVSLLRDAA
jgi:hypothetical protein